jgi:glycosyltransferase involved in cell wall biosynthesis
MGNTKTLTRPHVAVFIPRARYDNVRACHKEGWTLTQLGYRVTVVSRDPGPERYLGMRMLRADAPSNSLLRWLVNMPRLLAQARSLQADLYLLCNPDTILLACALKFAGKRVIYDTWEDFSRRPHIHSGLPRFLRAFACRSLTWGERCVARLAEAVIVTQPQQLRSLGPKALLLDNAPLIEGPVVEEANRQASELSTPDHLNLIYVGTMSRTRGMISMLDLLQRINEYRVCRLTLIGWCSDKTLLLEAQQHPAWQYVDFLGRLSHAETLARISKANLGLALLDDVADYPTSSITKLYEYMQFGTPFVATAFERWRNSLRGTEAGLFVDPTDIENVAQSILSLVSDPQRLRKIGRNGADFIAREFNWGISSRSFLRCVTALIDVPACEVKQAASFAPD